MGSHSPNIKRAACRQLQTEDTALAQSTFSGDGSAAQLHNPMHQCQTEPVAHRNPGGIALIEFIKNMAQILRPYSRTLIPNGHENTAIFLRTGNEDL